MMNKIYWQGEGWYNADGQFVAPVDGFKAQHPGCEIHWNRGWDKSVLYEHIMTDRIVWEGPASLVDDAFGAVAVRGDSFVTSMSNGRKTKGIRFSANK